MHLCAKRVPLAVRADDFGLHRSCDAVMLRLVREGWLENVSVQANGPDLPQSANALRASNACVGLHLSFTCEWRDTHLRPCSPPDRVPNLLRSNRLPADTAGLVGVPVEELLTEADAQLRRLRDLGLRPAYADAHMGANHAHPELDRQVRSWAMANQLSWIDDVPRLPRPTGGPWFAGVGGGPYLLVLHPGDASANLVMRADPTRSVGRERAAEASLLVASIEAARRESHVTLHRLDDPTFTGVARFCT